jgi:hypothetical protein
MALKKLVDVGEAFPVKKKPRLGVAPPPADVLDNVGAPDLPPVPVAVKEEPPVRPRENLPEARSAQAAPVQSHSGDGRGVHTGKGIDARRQIKTGRNYQFGARTTVAFADEVKRIAANKEITIGELLEDMLAAYRAQAQ